MTTKAINCEICGASVHTIKKHLRDEHEEWTLEKYQEEFPDAPIFSELALRKIEEARSRTKASVTQLAEANPAQQIIEQQSVKVGKIEMGKAFRLGNTKATVSQKSGNPIMITQLQRDSVNSPDMIPEFDDGYIFDIEVLKTLLMGIELSIPTYLYGHAGLGKSTIFEQIASVTNRPIRRVQHTVNTEESHIVGQYVVNHVEDPKTGELKAKTEFQLGDLPLAMMNGEIFLADEYDRAYPSVLSVYQAVLEGKPLHIKDAPEELRVIKPHPQFRFVATGNTNGAGDDTGLYQATVVQDAATFERFGIVERIDYMPKKQEVAILRAKTGLLEEDASDIVKFATHIRKDAFPNEVSLTIGPRVLLNIARVGIARFNTLKGIEVAYANRLPEAERQAAMNYAQRIFG